MFGDIRVDEFAEGHNVAWGQGTTGGGLPFFIFSKSTTVRRTVCRGLSLAVRVQKVTKVGLTDVCTLSAAAKAANSYLTPARVFVRLFAPNWSCKVRRCRLAPKGLMIIRSSLEPSFRVL